MLPHLGHLHLDFEHLAQEWLLVHTITNEVVNFGKRRGARLLFGDDGFGVIHYCDDNVEEEEAAVSAGELLKYGVYEGLGNEYFVQVEIQEGNMKVKSLKEMRQVSQQIMAALRMETTSFNIQWPVAIFEMRCGGGFVQ